MTPIASSEFQVLHPKCFFVLLEDKEQYTLPNRLKLSCHLFITLPLLKLYKNRSIFPSFMKDI